MNECHGLPGNNPSSSSTLSPAAPPLVIVAAVGDPGGSRAAAAALTCAGIGGAQAPLFIELAGTAPRPTLLASVQARALEERLVTVVPGIAAAARGGFCQVALRADSEGFATAAAAVGAAGFAPTVVHVPGARLSALLDDALASRASAALVRSETEVDRALAAPVALELLSRGFAVALLERRLGWVTERRALFGALRATDLHELPRAPIQWLASYALGVPNALSESPAVAGFAFDFRTASPCPWSGIARPKEAGQHQGGPHG
jgi:hypothetical protein